MLGFDIDAATIALYREALAAGAIPVNPDQPNAKVPAGIRDVAEAHLHGLEPSRCSRRPCRTAGLCHALYELVQYRREVEDPQGVIASANAAEAMRKALQNAGDEFMPVLEKLIEQSDQRHRDAVQVGVAEARSEHEILCTRPGQLVIQMTALLLNVDRFERELRGRVSSFELQQSKDKRPGNLLLTAVYQHLHWGGLTYREIATLVPDELVARGAEERVRSRVRSENARSLMPSDLYEEMVRRRTEKLAKRASSS